MGGESPTQGPRVGMAPPILVGGSKFAARVWQVLGGFLLRFCALGWVGFTSGPLTTEGSRSFIKRVSVCSTWSKKWGNVGSFC